MLDKIKEHEEGKIEFEEFEQVSTRMVKIKYKAEVSF